MNYKVGDDLYFSSFYGDTDDRAMISKKRLNKKGAKFYKLKKVHKQDMHSPKPRLTKRSMWHDEEHLNRNWKKIGSMKP